MIDPMTLAWVAFWAFIIFGWDAVMWPIRLPMYMIARKKHKRHEFKAHLRKDIGTITNYCDVCYHNKRNWIHPKEITDAAELDAPIAKPSKLLELETADIKWRFKNDPEWVQVFGEEFDPKTFQPIPQFHNGECGGPHDSCERCAYEADKAEAEAKEKRMAETQADMARKAEAKKEVTKLDQEEIEAYEDILWTLWNTCHDPEEAYEEFQDIRDELGMLTNAKVRQGVAACEPFQRIVHCASPSQPQYWKRREERWHNKVQQDKRRRYDPYDIY